MAHINKIETESIQVGLAAAPPIAAVDLWPSMDPTVPFTLQSTGINNHFAITNQIGVHNGIGAHLITGLESLLGFKTGLGGQANAEPTNYSAAFTGAFNGSWNLNESPILTAATDYDSDITLKKNIQPLESSLDKVLKLQGVSFEWNEEKVTGPGYIREGRKEFGFIAQDVEDIFPDLVSDRRNGEDTTKMVKYKNIIAVLVEAIKEQQEQIEELKRTVTKPSTRCAKCSCSC